MGSLHNHIKHEYKLTVRGFLVGLFLLSTYWEYKLVYSAFIVAYEVESIICLKFFNYV